MNKFQRHKEFWVHKTRRCVCGWDLFPNQVSSETFFSYEVKDVSTTRDCFLPSLLTAYHDSLHLVFSVYA